MRCSFSNFLPGHAAPERRLALGILALAPFLFGLLTSALGQDANWDLRNYHWYNAYAFLNGRYGFDLLPSQTPYFYNPTIDVPYFLLANAVPVKWAAFILGSVQGLNCVLLFMLAFATLPIIAVRAKVLIAAVIAALGMLGGGGIAQLGTVFYDNVTSLGVFLSALLVLQFWPKLAAEQLPRVLLLALLCGVPAGMMMGLKLPSVIFCVGLNGAMLLLPGSLMRRMVLAFGFGLGILLGIAFTYGHWGWHLQQHFGSPLFPYFNDFFKAPLAPLTSARDTQFLPASWTERLLFPFIFTENPKRVGEIAWRDWRLAILYGLVPVALLGWAIQRVLSLSKPMRHARADGDDSAKIGADFLLAMAGISYVVWLFMFAIYRYALPLEMLAPLLIVLLVMRLPLGDKPRVVLAAGLLVVVACSVQGGDWTRKHPRLEKAVEAELPTLGDTKNLMILMAGFEPYSHLVTVFPPEIPFVRIQSNFASPDENKAINQVIADRLAAHQGRFKLLIPPWQHELAETALRHFDLTLLPQTCQKVVDKLYDEYQLDLCDIARLKDANNDR